MLSTIKALANNNRFYVLVFSFLVSVFAVFLLRIRVVDYQLYYIQLEQVFGFLSLACLYATLIISPVQKIIGTPDWMKNAIFARRGLGVSAAYFALLHVNVTLWRELGGFSGLTLLPDTFVWPLISGAIALSILCVLTCISLDKMIIHLGYHRWKWTQRLVYVGGILIIVHVWAIGVHFAPGAVRNICLAALTLLFGLESWRMVHFLAERYHWHKIMRYPLFLALWFFGILLLGWISFSRPAEAHMLLKDAAGEKGTILHITPDDDPIAGERTSIVFEVQDTSSDKRSTTAKLAIIDDQDHTTNVPARVQGKTVTAAYIFPRQGLYTLVLSIQQGDTSTHRFTESQRVSRGVINSATVYSPPLWAGAGLLCTVMTAIAVTIIAFSRRKAINTYSKL